VHEACSADSRAPTSELAWEYEGTDIMNRILQGDFEERVRVNQQKLSSEFNQVGITYVQRGDIRL
jgi:hypothetical protein